MNDVDRRHVTAAEGSRHLSSKSRWTRGRPDVKIPLNDRQHAPTGADRELRRRRLALRSFCR